MGDRLNIHRKILNMKIFGFVNIVHGFVKKKDETESFPLSFLSGAIGNKCGNHCEV